MDTPPPINHLSLCSGYEGIGLALSRVLPTCRTIAHVEIEAFAVANLVNKMEEGKLDPCPVWTDVKTFDGKPFRGLVDILSGGFPCTPFSQAGKREADESANHLFPYFLNVIETVHPTVLFLENVEGLISAKLKGNDWSDPAGTPVLLHVCRELERRGYEATWGIFSASEIGAPQQRKRVFICARRNKVSLVTTEDCFRASLEEIGERAQFQLADAHSNESASIRGDNGEVSEVSAEQGQEHCAVVSGGEGVEGRELADSNSQRFDGQQISVQPRRPQQEGNETVRSSRETRCPASQGQEQQRRELADSNSSLHQGRISGRSDQGRENLDGYDRRGCAGVHTQWPARPGEKQRSFEEPRAVASKSELGGATDGSASGVDATINRVDRLRLLGNGVVVETASKAFVTLMRELDG